MRRPALSMNRRYSPGRYTLTKGASSWLAGERMRTRPLGRSRSATIFAATYGFGDRKSTRLNSSHSQISYAVFCLKKKRSQERVRDLSGGEATDGDQCKCTLRCTSV